MPEVFIVVDHAEHEIVFGLAGDTGKVSPGILRQVSGLVPVQISAGHVHDLIGVRFALWRAEALNGLALDIHSPGQVGPCEEFVGTVDLERGAVQGDELCRRLSHRPWSGPGGCARSRSARMPAPRWTRFMRMAGSTSGCQ